MRPAGIGALLTALACLAQTACSRETSSPARAPESPPSNAAAAPRAAFPFSDATASSGVDFDHDSGATGRHHYVETMAPGVALFDADNDDDLDLYVVDGGPLPGATDGTRPRNRFYLNRGDGTFEDHTGADMAGDQAYGMGVSVGDYDGDGDLDLYALNYGPNVLYRNEGGSFSAHRVGAEGDDWSVAGLFFDHDRDGDLDLYVVNYLVYDVEKEGPCRAGTLDIYCSPEQYPPATDRLYRNDDGRFVEISRAAGIEPEGRGMGLVASDFDDDGDTDLYITNDRSQNFLYVNAGDGFSEMGAETGVGYSAEGMAEGGMGAAAGDFTGDGRPGIFHTNFQKEPNRLFVASGDGFFEDLTFQSGIGFASSALVSWGIGVFDLEGDGDIDLAVANGHVFENAEEFIPGISWRLSDHLLLNDGKGRFEVRDFPGEPRSSRGVATGDIDGDGDIDLVIAACGEDLRIWRNDTDEPGRFAVIDLRAEGANTHAYGARVIARSNGRVMRREVSDGGSYASHSDTRVTFGLDGAPALESVEVRWPDGAIETLGDLEGGQALLWRQGEGIVERRALRSPR